MKYDGLNSMVPWERQKALYIIEQAEKLGMDLDGYGEIGVNAHSGYTYLWLEDYDFVLYMPISCDLIRSDIWVLWTNMDNGDEEEEQLTRFDDLDDIYAWVRNLHGHTDNYIDEE